MSTKTSKQRLAPLEATECQQCHKRVHFKTRSSRPVDERHRIAYLVCPVCGAVATQLQEIGARRRRVYVYEE